MEEKDRLKLVVRYLSGECDDEEKKTIYQSIQTDRQLCQLLKALQVKENIVFTEDIDIAWQRVKNGMEKVSAEKRFRFAGLAFGELFSRPWRAVTVRRTLQFASIFLVLSVAAWSFKFFRHHLIAPQPDYQVITVENGQRTHLNLSDGTHIVLDAGSTLRYPQRFYNLREVFLQGEAYFEVAHNQHKPFCVHANHATIRVLGTRFNVRAWKENPAVAVTVAEGRVALSSSNEAAQKAVVIPKGYFSSLTEEGTPTTPVAVDVESHLRWRYNEIRFKDASVEEVMAQLQRWYDYQFDVDDRSVLKQRMTVHIQMTNIDDVLELISILTDTKITKDGKTIKIRAKK
ncbi:MAG TPA: FecR domain-containing protein [bacterium]|nr:FecR domain-containing protein [bacterium]